MKGSKILWGAGVLGALFLLFVISVYIAGALLGERKSLAVGDGVGLLEVKGIILDSAEPIKELKNLADDRNVKAIVLRIDSPGGVVGPSQEIYEEVKKVAARKKVVVSMGSVAASGGYYIAAPATKIYANPGSITGSIGVILKFSNMEGLLGKIGMKAYAIKSGAHKDLGSPIRPMTKGDRDIIQGVIDNIHDQFVRAVAEGRKIPLADVKQLADGRIFTGEQALGLKLVDKLGNQQDAVAEAARLAGVKGEPRLITPPKKKRNVWDVLTGEAENRLGAMLGRSGFSASYELESGLPLRAE